MRSDRRFGEWVSRLHLWRSARGAHPLARASKRRKKKIIVPDLTSGFTRGAFVVHMIFGGGQSLALRHWAKLPVTQAKPNSWSAVSSTATATQVEERQASAKEPYGPGILKRRPTSPLNAFTYTHATHRIEFRQMQFPHTWTTKGMLRDRVAHRRI